MADRNRPLGSGGAGRPRVPATSVRRNLFQSQLTRRPTPASSNSTETMRLEGDVLSDSTEIVVRDQHGEIELGDPPTPILEDAEDLITADGDEESEKERQRLTDAVKHHQVNSTSIPNRPEELLEAVQASLRAKVAALSDDNWMFEREEPARF